jgi:DNA-directed RNA polymerase subunit RPC12/RpoP/ribosomal protein L40E
MIIFPCHVCQTPLSAEETQAGQLVRCPTCSTTLRVPANAGQLQTVGAGGGGGGGGGGAGFNPPPRQSGLGQMSGFRSGGRRYGFNCGYCSSRLEATEAMAAQDGQCPTCGNNITIPILDRYGRLIDPKTRQIIKQDPHPVHAYAAAGDRAPKIIRQKDTKQIIVCPRCSAASPITANNCKSCGMPFTMEGTTLEAAGSSNGFCVASLVLGIIGLPAFCTFVTPVLAIIFGIIGFNQVGKTGSEGGGKGMAIAGIVCGVIGCILALLFYANRM